MAARRRGREVRQRPAKPRTAVRVRSAPCQPWPQDRLSPVRSRPRFLFVLLGVPGSVGVGATLWVIRTVGDGALRSEQLSELLHELPDGPSALSSPPAPGDQPDDDEAGRDEHSQRANLGLQLGEVLVESLALGRDLVRISSGERSDMAS